MNPTHSVRRRGFLQSGLGLLTAAAIQRRLIASPRGRSQATADRCIIVLLTGGPSHLDSWDPKPNAPLEIRGPFQTIQTTVPGICLSEHLPKLAKQMHRCALVRSVHHKRGGHAAAAYVALTGVDAGVGERPASRGDHPAIGSVMAMKCESDPSPLPYVWLPFKTSEVGLGGQPIPGMLGGFLGPKFDPFFVHDDPSDPDFSVPSLQPQGVNPMRMNDRMHLLDRLSRTRTASFDNSYRETQQQAVDLLTSTEARRAFALQNEPQRLRDHYGDHRLGASMLLARRLVESGSRVVCVSMDRNLNNTWDTHHKNFLRLERALLPQFDRAISALLDDLTDRGMLDRTLVLAFGEFGRTPKINSTNAGRDHWPSCYTLLMAGGGMKRGFVFGKSDKLGAFPDVDPVTPSDIIATMYRCLGVSDDGEYGLVDQLDRPVEVAAGGRAIHELLG